MDKKYNPHPSFFTRLSKKKMTEFEAFHTTEFTQDLGKWKQDKASIEFVIKLCRNYDGAKSALEKLRSESGTKI